MKRKTCSCSSVWIEHLRPNDMEVNRARRRFCDDDYVGIKITTFEERIIRESRGSRVRTALFKKALAENQRVKGFENRVGSATPFLRKKSCTKRREKLYQKKRKAVPKEVRFMNNISSIGDSYSEPTKESRHVLWVHLYMDNRRFSCTGEVKLRHVALK